MTLNFIKLNLSFLLGSVCSGIIMSQNLQLFGLSCLVGLLNIIPSSFFCLAQRMKYKPVMLITLYYLPWLLIWTILVIFLIKSDNSVFEQSKNKLELFILFTSFFGTLTSSRIIFKLLKTS